MTNYSSPIPENKAWREASLTACKTDARDYCHNAHAYARVHSWINAVYTFERALSRLSRAHQYAEEIILEHHTSKTSQAK